MILIPATLNCSCCLKNLTSFSPLLFIRGLLAPDRIKERHLEPGWLWLLTHQTWLWWSAKAPVLIPSGRESTVHQPVYCKTSLKQALWDAWRVPAPSSSSSGFKQHPARDLHNLNSQTPQLQRLTWLVSRKSGNYFIMNSSSRSRHATCEGFWKNLTHPKSCDRAQFSSFPK